MIFAPSLRGSGGSAFPRVCVENTLAQAKRFWRCFHVFICIDVFDGALQGHPQWRFQLNSLAFALAAHVGKVLFPARIDWQVLRARVFAYYHSLVDVLLRPNEKPAALLNTVEGVSSADPGFHRHHHTTTASTDFAFERRVFAKKVTHQSLSASQVYQIGLESNQAARRDHRFD